MIFSNQYEMIENYISNLQNKICSEIGNSFLKSYLPIIEKRKNETYSDDGKQFQLFRRGRYVEFNLIYDRGTLLELKTGGRIESILMSLPPEVKFLYNYKPQFGSAQEKMIKLYQPKDWIL